LVQTNLFNPSTRFHSQRHQSNRLITMQDQLLDTQNKEALQEQLLEKIEKKEYTVGIIGLGYVGLPLMWTFHEMGMPVLGLDIDEKKVSHIEEGRPYIKHLGEAMMEVLSTYDR